MFFRNYSVSYSLLRRLMPALIRATLWTAVRMSPPAWIAMLRISLRRSLVWLPHKLRQWRTGLAMPVTLTIIDDIGCRAACANCVFTAFRVRGERLSLQDVDRVLDQALQMNITNVYMLGADPFYRPDIDAFLDVLAKHKYQFFLLFTEGKKITPAHVARIRRAGNIIPVLNIDGLQEASDRRKGEGTFRVVDELLALLRKERVLFGVTCMASQANFDEVSGPAFARYLDEQGASFLAYVPYTPVDRKAEAGLVLDGPKRDELFERSMQLNHEVRRLAVFDMLGIEQKLTSCPAGVYSITVYHDGTVTPCVAVPAGHQTSNVKTRSLMDIFTNDPLYVAMRQRHQALARRNRQRGTEEKIHCMFYTDTAFLRGYFAQHRPDIRVLAPYAIDYLDPEQPGGDS